MKSLLKAGISFAAIAAIFRKDPGDIAKIAEKVIGKGYALGQCLDCANDLLTAFRKAGYEGKLVTLVSETGTPIFKAGEESGRPIADAVTQHYGVQVGDMIYEMNSTKGIPVAKWASRYTTGGLDANGRLTTLVAPVIKDASIPR
jgi:hypothetical protein